MLSLYNLEPTRLVEERGHILLSRIFAFAVFETSSLSSKLGFRKGLDV